MRPPAALVAPRRTRRHRYGDRAGGQNYDHREEKYMRDDIDCKMKNYELYICTIVYDIHTLCMCIMCKLNTHSTYRCRSSRYNSHQQVIRRHMSHIASAIPCNLSQNLRLFDPWLSLQLGE